ncbi:hypothetical protein LXL04_031036 [Taraxacum kok-saghyz]
MRGVTMVLTAHFIDHEWKMQKRILNFCQIPNHKGDTIGKATESCLKEWGIENVFTITVDNASSNNVAISHIKKRLQIWKTAVCNGEFLHMRCSAHILNLVVGDGLKELNDSIAVVRNAVRYIRASPARLGSFQNCVKSTCKEGKAIISLDVATRWNSTFLMLDRAIKYSDAFKLLEEDDEHYVKYFSDEDRNGRSLTGPPDSKDWDNCAIFCKFLKIFYEATLKFSASKFVTANSYFHEICTVRGRILKLCANNQSILKEMACKMKTKFDKYWGCVEKQNVLLYVAIVLDPRYKMRFVTLCLNKLYSSKEVETITTSMNSSLLKLFSYFTDEFKLRNPEVGTTQSGSFIPKNSSMFNISMVEDDDDDCINMFESEFDKECEKDGAFDVSNELDRYLGERNDEERKNKDFDVLEWWKISSSKYPILAMMARDVLAIQVSIVASESAFSTGGRVLDSFRSSLNPSMVQALICCQNWLRTSDLALDMSSLLEDIDAYEDDDSDYHFGTDEYRAPLILYRFPAPSTHIKRQRLFTPPPARELPLRPIANSGASNSIANDQPPASSTLHRSGDTDLLHRHIFSDPPLLPATLLHRQRPSSGDTDLLHRHLPATPTCFTDTSSSPAASRRCFRPSDRLLLV